MELGDDCCFNHSDHFFIQTWLVIASHLYEDTSDYFVVSSGRLCKFCFLMLVLFMLLIFLRYLVVLGNMFKFMEKDFFSVLLNERCSFSKLSILIFLEVNTDSQGCVGKTRRMHMQEGFSYRKWLPCLVGVGLPSFLSADVCGILFHFCGALRVFHIRMHNLFGAMYSQHIKKHTNFPHSHL